jgi:hypothetical protein
VVRNNVSIDVKKCGRDNTIDQAVAVVNKIVAKIPQR